MAKGNPNPVQTQQFKAKQFKAVGEIPGDSPLAKQPVSIKLPIDVSEAIRSLPASKRIPWLRRVICDAVRKELTTAE